MAPVVKMEAPVCLIANIVENGKSRLVTNPEALELLARIEQPVVVVAIVGLYRTGKSYLMNKLAGAQKGFNLGATVQSETKGIWMWCVPHPTMNGRTLVLLDTEGLGDVEKGDNKNDIWLFSLAVLLSSALVYNSKGTIDQDAVDKLKFVGEITEFIKVKATNNDNEEAELSSHFPIFIWAIRDFHLGLQIDGRPVSEDEYLENALKLRTPARTMKDQMYNLPRECIRMYFGKRKCFVFPLPTADEASLQRLEEVGENLLNPNFVAQSEKFRDYVFSNAEVKSVKDVPIVTGPRLGGLAKIYTEAISNTNVACMEDAVLSLADQENQTAIQAAIGHYEGRMKEVQLPTETLDNFIERSRRHEAEARELFMKKSFKDDGQKFLQQFMENIVKKKAEFIALNEARSREVCAALIMKHATDFESALSNKAFCVRGGHAKFLQALKAVEDKYMKENGKGVKAEDVLQEYKRSKQDCEIQVIQEDNALSLSDKQEQEKEMKRKCEQMERKVQELDDAHRRAIEETQARMQQETMDRLVQKMEEERRMMSEKMEKVLQEKERERELYLQQSLDKQAEMFKEQIADLKRQKEESLDFGILNSIVSPIVGLLKIFGGKKGK